MEMIEESKDRSHRLFCHADTYECAVTHSCIPCVYKLFPNAKALSLPPNQRPEMCVRARANSSHPNSTSTTSSPPSSSSFSKGTNILGLYSSGCSMLTVGDGDFSFSLSLARHLASIDLIATSYESLSSLKKTYWGISDTLHELAATCREVLHDIDGRDIPNHKHFKETSTYEKFFDYIVWNFPCVGDPQGHDGQASEVEENKTMLTKFFQTCGSLLKDRRKSEVHVTHKTLEPFSW